MLQNPQSTFPNYFYMIPATHTERRIFTEIVSENIKIKRRKMKRAVIFEESGGEKNERRQHDADCG